MGIYDRDYYRREGPSFLASFAQRGRVCKALIIINIVCYILQWISWQMSGFGQKDPDFTNIFILDPTGVLQGQIWRLLTYAFLHSTGPWHIIINMAFLWWFGSDVEDLYGPREFLAFYLLAAILGGIAYVPFALATPIVHPETGARFYVPCLGASGAVMAVLVLCACHYPTRVIYLFLLIPVPIWLFAVFMVLKDLVGLIGPQSTPVAVIVHLAGAAFAFPYYKFQWRVLGWLPNLRRWKRERARPKLRVYREEETAPPGPPVPVGAPNTPADPDLDEQLEAKLDAVLEKVKRFGQSSLSDTEREILFRASEFYKKRRK